MGGADNGDEVRSAGSSSTLGTAPTHTYFCSLCLTTAKFLNISSALECVYALGTVLWLGNLVMAFSGEGLWDVTNGKGDWTESAHLLYLLALLGTLHLLFLNLLPLVLLIRVRQLYLGLVQEGKFTGVGSATRILREARMVIRLMQARILSLFLFSLTPYCPFAAIWSGTESVQAVNVLVSEVVVLFLLLLLCHTTLALWRLHDNLQLHLMSD